MSDSGQPAPRRHFNNDPKASTQPCGCDPGLHVNGIPSPYYCEQHQREQMQIAEMTNVGPDSEGEY